MWSRFLVAQASACFLSIFIEVGEIKSSQAETCTTGVAVAIGYFGSRRASSLRSCSTTSSRNRDSPSKSSMSRRGKSDTRTSTQSAGVCACRSRATRTFTRFDHFRCRATVAIVWAGSDPFAYVFKSCDSVRNVLSSASCATGSGPCAISPAAMRADPRLASIIL